jgi:methyltransferase
MVTIALATAVGVVAAQRVLELRLARRNESWARERGAVEHGAGHYPLFFVLHAGWMIGLVVEALVREEMSASWPWWVGAFALAQGLRYWAIASLGPRWNTRVLVLPNAPLVREGPYRWIRHPNYVAVVIELAALPLAFGAVWTASIVSLLNLALLLGVRIPCENRALRGPD